MVEVQALDVTVRRHFRGIVRASITKLDTHISELERKQGILHSDLLAAKWLRERLHATGLDSEFKSYHLSIVALVDEEEDLDTEKWYWMTMYHFYSLQFL